MTATEVQKFMNDHKGYFYPDDEKLIYQSLLAVDDATAKRAMNANFKKPKTVKIISLLFGWLGIDRLVNGDYLAWLLKEATFGFFLIGWIMGFKNAVITTQSFNSAKLLVVIFPGKIKKPTLLASLKHTWQNDPEFRQNLIQSTNNIKRNFQEFQDTTYLN